MAASFFNIDSAVNTACTFSIINTTSVTNSTGTAKYSTAPNHGILSYNKSMNQGVNQTNPNTKHEISQVFFFKILFYL